MHGIGMFTPLGELVGIQGKLLLQASHDGGILIKQDRAVRSGEPVQLGLRRGPGLGRRDGLDGGLDDVGPQLAVLGVEQDHDARRLRVERAGHVQHGLVDELVDLRVRHRRRRRQLVVCAPAFDRVEERGGHFGGGGEGSGGEGLGFLRKGSRE